MLDNLNTQCVEQLWRRLVRWGSMLRYMSRGAHRLMYYTLVQSHNEKLKAGKVKKTPRPKKHRTVHEFNRVKKSAVQSRRFLVAVGDLLSVLVWRPLRRRWTKSKPLI
jgi:hypothetical protein